MTMIEVFIITALLMSFILTLFEKKGWGYFLFLAFIIIGIKYVN